MATDPANLLPAEAIYGTPDALGTTHLLEEQVRIDDSRGRERATMLSRLLAFSDLMAGAAAGALAAFGVGLTGDSAFLYSLAVAGLWYAAVFSIGLYNIDTLGSWASGLKQLGRLGSVALAISWPLTGIAALVDAADPIAAALGASTLVLLLAVLGRTTVRAVLHRVTPLRQRTLILGSGMVAGQVVERLRRHPEFGLDPIGLVDDDAHDVDEVGLPVLGQLELLGPILEHHNVDRVVIAFSRASHEQLLAAMRACRDQRVAVDVVPRLFEFLEGARALERIGGLPVLSIGAHRLSRSSAVAKRSLDIVFSIMVLIAIAPIAAVIALAIKLDSRGPVLFRQARAGRDGEPFLLLKFRSMHVGADERKLDLLHRNERDEIMFKLRRDPRVTRVGSFLRRLSLDELPQLVNVLKGDMSLVGPRPLMLPESQALGSDWHARRLDLRPGLTGPWQVSGRSDLSAHDMVRMDFQYATGWSLARDLEILLATVPAVLSGRGAY
jgi:exopolysaccharide biosynthesis polyprenyl glycosylphosphotransferase